MIKRNINEECGVVGICSQRKKYLAKQAYYAMYALQHRGQESCGIAVNTENGIEYYKNRGLVSDVFGEKELQYLPQSDFAVGHVRYATKDLTNAINAQPVVYTGKTGRMAVAFNGKLLNADELTAMLIEDGVIFQTCTDAEIISALFNKFADAENPVDGFKKAVVKLKGSFAIVIITKNMLFGVRDTLGLKPLVVGKNDDGDLFLASESCAIDALGGDVLRDVAPGEIVAINKDGIKNDFMDGAKKQSCVFEFVYLARADSIIDARSVYKARFECGKLLAQQKKIDADMIAGVPDSAVVAARGYATESGIPYIDVFEKNRYIGRTFIQPDQSTRENSVRIKLNVHKANIKGKKIILVDDSIVRGTTSIKIVEVLRKAGAKEIHMAIASPIVKNPCFYGTDIETKDQLVGAYRSTEEIAKIIGVDSLQFMDVEDLKKCCGKDGKDDGFCAACFDGKYPLSSGSDKGE